jgi:hypothetical protein
MSFFHIHNKHSKIPGYAALLLLIFLMSVPALHSMDWPSPSIQMTRNFGWNDEGIPHLGLTFENGQTLTAADNGELLFRRREGDTACRLPSPLGSWLALDHGDGIISIYSRFDDNAPLAVQDNFDKGSILGEHGISGWSPQRGFYFQIFDRMGRRWINPALLIHSREQTIPPLILSVRLRDSQGRTFNPAQIGNLSQGRYTISVEAIARSPRGTPLAPYRIISSINGREAGVLNFETYSTRDGSLMLYRNGLVTARQVFAPVPAYEIADVWFSRGQTTLEIIAQDITGITRNVVYRFTVL